MNYLSEAGIVVTLHYHLFPAEEGDETPPELRDVIFEDVRAGLHTAEENRVGKMQKIAHG